MKFAQFMGLLNIYKPNSDFWNITDLALDLEMQHHSLGLDPGVKVFLMSLRSDVKVLVCNLSSINNVSVTRKSI